MFVSAENEFVFTCNVSAASLSKNPVSPCSATCRAFGAFLQHLIFVYGVMPIREFNLLSSVFLELYSKSHLFYPISYLN